MRFFNRPDDEVFTHHARFFGVACWYGHDDGGGCVMMGKNVVYDWLLDHVCPHLHTVLDALHILKHGHSMPGFLIEVGPPIQR